jgi:hypothetical protein
MYRKALIIRNIMQVYSYALDAKLSRVRIIAVASRLAGWPPMRLGLLSPQPSRTPIREKMRALGQIQRDEGPQPMRIGRGRGVASASSPGLPPSVPPA